MCMGHYEIKTPIYENFIEKNICVHTNSMLEVGLMYLYQAFRFNETNVSTIHTKFKS